MQATHANIGIESFTKDLQSRGVLLESASPPPQLATLSVIDASDTLSHPIVLPMPPEPIRPGTEAIAAQLYQVFADCSETPEALDRIALTLRQAFQVDGCAIASQTSRAIAWATVPTASDQLLSDQLLKALVTTLAELAVPIVFSDLESLETIAATHPHLSPLINEWSATDWADCGVSSVRAILAVPMRFPDGTTGVIGLLHRRLRPWTAAEIAGLQTLSPQVAIGLSHLRLQARLHQQTHYQSVVNQLTLATRSAANLSEMLALATTGTAQALQASRGLLLRLKYWNPLHRNRQDVIPQVRVTIACEWGGSEPIASPDKPVFWLSECGLLQQAFRHPAPPLILPDGAATTETAIAALHLQAGSALLIMPLESQGTVLGFLVLQHDRPHSWTPDDLELVELVSAQVSTAIVQTETLRQVQALVDKRTAELQESLSIQAKLYDRTRQQIDQLRHLNQVKDAFLSTISHELRTPLTSMTLSIRMLRQPGLSSDRADRYLTILEQQCAQETNLINDLLALQELETKQVPMQREEINLKPLVHELADSFNHKWEAKGLTLDLNLPRRAVKLQTDRNSLNRILLELLTNAGKYSDPNGRVSLTLLQRPAPTREVVLTLCNTGACIAAADLPHIFEKFRRSQSATQDAVPGTGLGLALVESLVKHLNGTIAVQSKSDKSQCCETCFTLTLPQAVNPEK